MTDLSSGVDLGWQLSTGGREERYAGRLVDAAHEAFTEAYGWDVKAECYHDPLSMMRVYWRTQAAIDRARGRAFLDALALIRDDLTDVDADRIYTDATGHLPG